MHARKGDLVSMRSWKIKKAQKIRVIKILLQWHPHSQKQQERMLGESALH